MTTVLLFADPDEAAEAARVIHGRPVTALKARNRLDLKMYYDLKEPQRLWQWRNPLYVMYKLAKRLAPTTDTDKEGDPREARQGP